MPQKRKAPAKFPATPALPESLLGAVPGIIWTTDLDLRITATAGRPLKTTESSAKNFLGSPVHVFLQQSETNTAIRVAHFRAAKGVSCSLEFEIAGVEYRARLEPLFNEQGTTIGVVGIAFEDTERLVAQRALRMSQQSYRSFIEGAPYAIGRCAPSGTLLQVNRAMQEMLGYSEPDLLMRNLQSETFAHREDYSAFLENLRQHKSWHGFETQWLRQNGSTVHVSLGGRAICDPSGEVSYVDFIAENISERKQLEEQFRHAQKLQAVGQFAGGIAHDFNNLLTIISGQAEIMTEGMVEGDPLATPLKDIHSAAQRAGKLTRQLLAFSRRQVFQTTVVDLNAIVADMSQMLARLMGGNIELEFVPQPELWGVKVDAGQMEQVLMNLAVNARDAMPDGGRLIIETQNISAAAIQKNRKALLGADHVLLTVRDTGHGMDEATRARIFEPFFTTKQAGKGTGLGLSVVYGVVKQSGGTVYVESAPNAGTVFRICLPRSIGAQELQPQLAHSELSQGSGTVLIVEDDPDIRTMMQSFLERNGYRVLSAIDGIQAITIARSHPEIGLLLSDMMLPGLSGRELASKVKEILPEVKVLLMSGDPAGVPSDAQGPPFLQKPFSLQKLAKIVREILEKPKHATAAGGH